MNRLDPTLPLVFGEEIVEGFVDTTRRHYVGCTFTNCVVWREAGAPAQLIDCTFRSCPLTGDGWPPGWREATAPAARPAFHYSAKLMRRGYDPT